MDILLELVQEMGLEAKRVASTGGGEYHSPCPLYGGKDRFFIQPNYQMKNCVGRYACRQCDISGDTIQFCRDILGLDWGQAITKSHAHIPQESIVRFERPLSAKINPLLHVGRTGLRSLLTGRQRR